jgi:Ca2+-transporting ATPase
MDTNWFKQTYLEAAEQLEVNPEQGLTSSEANDRLKKYGLNELVEKAGRTRWQILWEQLTGILTIILFVAALVSFFLGEYVDGIAILAIIILNAALGFSQEYRAEQSMAALKRMSVPTVRVRRDKTVVQIAASEIVPGDIVLLETGNVIPADGRVTKSVNIRVIESALTGESEPVDKDQDLVFDTDRPLGDRRNMLYSGTIVSYGHGEYLVTETGMQTELGHIAEMIQSVKEEKTPLQKRLDKLGKALAVAAIVIVVIIFIIGYRQAETQEELEEVFLTSVSLAVAAIPEALTAVVTIALSLGAQRMLKRRALIRKLPAVETLGSVTVICSDKTGTLTQNRMTVTALDIANHRVDLIQRPGERQLTLVPASGDQIPHTILPTLDLLLISGSICNDAILAYNPDEKLPAHFHAVGDPTEGALILAAAEYGILKTDLDIALPRVAELPFDSVRKRMTTVSRMPTSGEGIPESLCSVWERRPNQPLPPYMAFTKGAIDGMLDIAAQVWVEGELQPLDESWKTRIQAAHDQLAQNGMRVLGVGLRGLDHAPGNDELATLENNLVLVGLFGMMDPPRPEVKAAIQVCRSAGIHAVMITGDHPLTARHIGRQLGMTDDDAFLTGQELESLNPDEIIQATKKVSVFARVSPEHKLKLVQAYQAQNEIVAMTGDGVNDAPALRKADIGVAMGITGTDVSKEAADMVLLDDNFTTIVSAVEEGRIIFDNIRRFIKYLLTCNASEIAVMFFGPLLGLPLPLLPLQILWMNLVTDGLPALALGIEPAEKNVMKRPPFSPTESIFGRGFIQFIVGMGIIMSVISIVTGLYFFNLGYEHWQTILFTTLIFAQLSLALEARSEENSLFTIGLFSNRSMLGAIALTVVLQLMVIYLEPLQQVFETQALTLVEMGIALSAGLLVILFAELWKFIARRRSRKNLIQPTA